MEALILWWKCLQERFGYQDYTLRFFVETDETTADIVIPWSKVPGSDLNRGLKRVWSGPLSELGGFLSSIS